MRVVRRDATLSTGPTAWAPQLRAATSASTRLLLVWFAVVWLAACGGYAHPESASAPYYPAQKSGGAPAPPPSPMPMDADGAYDLEESDEAFGESLSRGMVAQSKGKDSTGRPYEAEPPPKAEVRPLLIVYSGYLKLRVRRVLEAIDEITRATETRGGYIESLTSAVVVVRVPAKDFEGVMTEFAGFGEVLDQNIRAEDVTAQFTDVGARLAVAKEARARLLALLEQEKDVKERLAVVQEIKRLTEQIELMESTLATLQNLVDYFTITLELVPILENSRTTEYVSPFPWVRDLVPHAVTLYGGKDEFAIALPKAFVVFDDDDEFRAQSSDTAMLRAAMIDNDPRADAPYWSLAVRHEMLARGEKSVTQGQKGSISYEVFVNDDIKPRYYLVAVAVREGDLFVLEAFFPNASSYEEHGAALVTSLATFRAN
jgi:hypothetical protein